MMVGGEGGCSLKKEAKAAAARHHRCPFIFLHTTFLLLLLTTTTNIIQAQDMWYVTWTPGSLCNKKPAGDFQSWEQSFPTLENCCTAKMSYDYDNCCNPTAPGLPTCTEEFCVDRTCANGGLCSKELGMCLCIPPFGLDSDGDCTATGGNNENQFASCVVDVDCPWWSDPLRLEKCDTGSDIPDGVTALDWTREECCERHYPGSKFCNGIAVVVQGDGSGDDYVDLDMFELIPLKFFFGNLPDDEDGIDIDDLKEQVRIVLKDFLLNLSVRFTGAVEMGLSSIKETTRFNGLEKKIQLGGMDVYYDIKVVREPEQEFAPTIIEEVLDSYDDIVLDIQNKTTTDIYINICGEDIGGGLTIDSSSPMGSLSSFNECKLQPKEVTAKFRFRDLPQEIRNDASLFDDIKMIIMKAYKEMLTGGDGSIDGMMLLSIVDMGEVSFDDGTVDVQTNILYEGENKGVAYPSAIGDDIALSRDIVLNRLQSSMGEYNWCTKEEGTLTVCAPGEKGITPFPVWGYILIGSSIGVIVLLCVCRITGLGCANRNIATGRSRKSEQINQLNMESYIVTGHAAETSSSKRSRRSSATRVHHDRRVKSRHSRGGGRNDRRYRLSFSRSDGERNSSRRRSENYSRRQDRQPKRRRSFRKRSEDNISDDSDNFSVSSFDPDKQKSELVLYEGEQSRQRQQQQLVIYDEQEEPQSRRPDPDGLVLQLDRDNNQILQLEASHDDRLDTFRV